MGEGCNGFVVSIPIRRRERLDKDVIMTYIGHVKTINISYFKAHLSEELRSVRSGEPIVICDRDTPVARVVPYKNVKQKIHAPAGPFVLQKPKLPVKVDPLDLLLEDRGKR